MNFILLIRSVVVTLPSHVARLQNIRQTTEQGEEQELLYENMVSAMKGTVGRRFHHEGNDVLIQKHHCEIRKKITKQNKLLKVK